MKKTVINILIELYKKIKLKSIIEDILMVVCLIAMVVCLIALIKKDLNIKKRYSFIILVD
jgi:hypothetical protein